VKTALAEMDRDEVREAVQNRAVLLVPVATVEQHGPHLPLHTDIDNVNEICLETARRMNPESGVVVSPPVWFSHSPFDVRQFPGGVAVTHETFSRVLRELLESYVRGGFAKIAVVNGHGGGTEPWITRVVYSMRNERKSVVWPDWEIPVEARVVGFAWFALVGEFAREELAKARDNPTGSAHHAGDVETSLQLFLKPGLVDMAKARKGRVSKDDGFANNDLLNYQRRFVIDAYYPRTQSEGDVEGVLGDPTLASRELGESIFNIAVNTISDFLREFAKC